MNFRKVVGLACLLALWGCGGDDAAGPFGEGGMSGDASASGGRATGGRGGSSNGSGGTIGIGGGATGGGNATGGNGGATPQDGSIGDAMVDVSAGGTAGAGGGSAGGSAGSGGGSAGAGGAVTSDAGSDGAISCGVFNDLCTKGAMCCSGVCDPMSQRCTSVVGKCFAEGTPCNAPTDCCSLNCGSNGFCSAAACTSDGKSCSADGGNAACCSGKCNGTTCDPLNPSCRTAGNECSTSDQCCSHLCGKDGHCALGGSYCIQTGDACVHGGDCCGGICNIAAGAKLGTCDVPAPGATRCSGAVDGSFCNGCGTCCSRLCAPYGPTGVSICQPANGCHIDGDLCIRDQDCCGNDKSLPTSMMNVQCVKQNPTDPVGLCRNPMGCSPEGNVCFKKDYACSISTAPNNCCGAVGDPNACVLDPLGVPRCHGIGTCRKGGETCAFTGDCCNNVPCVPDATGQLRCLNVPDGGTICVPAGGNCTITGDCCPGTSCIVSQGSTQGKCGVITPPPPDGGTPLPDSGTSTDAGTTTDSGTTDEPPPVCSQYGQICTIDADCCNAIPCTAGICRIPPM